MHFIDPKLGNYITNNAVIKNENLLSAEWKPSIGNLPNNNNFKFKNSKMDPAIQCHDSYQETPLRCLRWLRLRFQAVIMAHLINSDQNINLCSYNKVKVFQSTSTILLMKAPKNAFESTIASVTSFKNEKWKTNSLWTRMLTHSPKKLILVKTLEARYVSTMWAGG